MNAVSGYRENDDPVDAPAQTVATVPEFASSESDQGVTEPGRRCGPSGLNTTSPAAQGATSEPAMPGGPSGLTTRSSISPFRGAAEESVGGNSLPPRTLFRDGYERGIPDC